MATLMRRSCATLLSRNNLMAVRFSRALVAPSVRSFSASTHLHTEEATSANSNSSQDATSQSSNFPAAPNAKGTPEAILKKALTLVPEYGWTTVAISKAAESMGYPAIIHGMFPNGGADLIDYFLQDCLNRLPLELEGRMDGLKTQEKIRLGTLTRLGMVAPYIDRWPEALAIMGQPSNVPMSLNHLGKIVDEIWHLAGDTSADMNWYTKRASLAGIYTTTELYMTTDKTPNYEATQRFLDRRFEDAATLGKATNEVLQIAEFGVKSVVGILNSKGLRF
ncbi:Ubiquinone biosynthesis protein coq9, mitochondrial [Mortierella sp. AD011]|nr:Ubiquinone biosynthesis protein coq9, mitochondrial [Mortierella sp. AD010]KAF9397176.1 Ubiquinone biosynthesis protein coq9, mitochondrial [Mortierella sp. AD011]